MLKRAGQLHPFCPKHREKRLGQTEQTHFWLAKVSDHFAIIPTLQAPKHLSEPEQKLYDLVVKRFMAVFYPAAEFMVTTRVTKVSGHHFQNRRSRIDQSGLARDLRARSAKDDDMLVAVAKDETVQTGKVEPKALQTRPPARSRATCSQRWKVRQTAG